MELGLGRRKSYQTPKVGSSFMGFPSGRAGIRSSRSYQIAERENLGHWYGSLIQRMKEVALSESGDLEDFACDP